MTGPAGKPAAAKPVSGRRSNPRVLIIDDDSELRDIIRESLQREGFEVTGAATGADALESVRTRPPELLVLDLGLPDCNGMDLLADLRTVSGSPVIILSGRSDEVDRILGLEMGADDYMTKPFSPRELAARARVVLRRSDRNDSEDPLRFGDLELEPAPREVRVKGQVVGLTAKEFDLLEFLMRSPRQVFSSEQILRHVWHSDPDWQSPNTVSEHIYRLRRKLRQVASTEWIVTVRGAGYRFAP